MSDGPTEIADMMEEGEELLSRYMPHGPDSAAWGRNLWILETLAAVHLLAQGPEALVYKVMGKMYALTAWESDPLTVTLKCEPGQALFLRDLYPAVQPGYHMNKAHWNTITLDGTIPQTELLGMIDDSYDLAVNSLTRAQRQTLAAS